MQTIELKEVGANKEDDHFFGNDDDILIFEILVRNLKIELNKILRKNDNLKSDLASYNNKKNLIAHFINTENNVERELLRNEIVSVFS